MSALLKISGLTLALRRGEALPVRGAEIGMVFQESMTSLNPAMTIGRQLEEGLALHRGGGTAGRRDRICAMLTRVGITDPAGAPGAHPRQFSGGMRQRIMLAQVMLPRPALLVADEPTTALDAVAQRDVLDLMVEPTAAEGTALLMISHDLGVVEQIADRVVVMERGRIVEQGSRDDIFDRPTADYTRRLLSAIPALEGSGDGGVRLRWRFG